MKEGFKKLFLAVHWGMWRASPLATAISMALGMASLQKSVDWQLQSYRRATKAGKIGLTVPRHKRNEAFLPIQLRSQTEQYEASGSDESLGVGRAERPGGHGFARPRDKKSVIKKQ